MFLRNELAVQQFHRLFREDQDGDIYFGWVEEGNFVPVTFAEYADAVNRFEKYHRMAMKLGWIALLGGAAATYFRAAHGASLLDALLALFLGIAVNFLIHLVPAPLASARVKRKLAAYHSRG